MPLKKIIAYLSCDKCDAPFTAHLENDFAHQPEGTIFDIAVERLDFVDDGTQVLKEAGHHEGEFYCPKCWEPKVEELFIAEIKSGKIPEQHLRDAGAYEEYAKYLPVPQLEHHA